MRTPSLLHRSAGPARMVGQRRGRSAPRRRTGARGRPASPVRGTAFHAPSFSAGVIMGAVVVLGAAYLPELLGDPVVAESPPREPEPERPSLTFEFDDLLRNSHVTADPDSYVSAPEAPPGEDQADEPAVGSGETFLLQAASFRSAEDAERLRAALLLMDLPAAINSITLANGRWHRVTVGPFDRRVEAERAMTRLREKDIAAIWTKRRAP